MPLYWGNYDIHCALERGWGIFESEGHTNESIKSMVGSEGGLVAIPWVDLYFPVTAVGIQGREDLFITELVYALFH